MKIKSYAIISVLLTATLQACAPAGETVHHTPVAGKAHASFKWQLVEDEGEYSTLRAKVPGGWLVMASSPGSIHSPSITFYPDPKHLWDGSTLP
ncbi:MAG: hypothetical protein M3Y56_11085 [Armatimonadota bacterium]|nr:hypothetical protein [Armatimonadota bacterium]